MYNVLSKLLMLFNLNAETCIIKKIEIITILAADNAG